MVINKRSMLSHLGLFMAPSPLFSVHNFTRRISAMENNNSGKKTMGRRKIEIKKIEKKTSLQVTFSKRRQGLFRKASELSVLAGAEIAILIQSPADKIFAFGNPSLESVLHRFQTGEISRIQNVVGEDRSKYENAARELEREKEKEKRIKERGFWLADEEFESMELDELEEYQRALEGLKDRVLQRVEVLEKLKIDPSLNLFPHYYFNGEHCSMEGLGETENFASGSGWSGDKIDQNFQGFEELEDLCYLENLIDF